MKTIFLKATAWLLWMNLGILVVMSLSCCKSSENKGKEAGGAAQAEAKAGEADSIFPAKMVEAIEKAKKEKKVAVIEVYDGECNYCLAMNAVLGNKEVISAIGKVVYCRVTIEEEALIEEYGITQSPTYLFYDHKGEYMDPFVTGFRSPNVLAAELNAYRLKAEGKEAPPIPEDPHPNYGKG